MGTPDELHECPQGHVEAVLRVVGHVDVLRPARPLDDVGDHGRVGDGAGGLDLDDVAQLEVAHDGLEVRVMLGVDFGIDRGRVLVEQVVHVLGAAPGVGNTLGVLGRTAQHPVLRRPARDDVATRAPVADPPGVQGLGDEVGAVLGVGEVRRVAILGEGAGIPGGGLPVVRPIRELQRRRDGGDLRRAAGVG